jgi:hypothetical protein
VARRSVVLFIFASRHGGSDCGSLLAAGRGICCDGDLQRRQIVPDYAETQREPVRICAFCFGRESADFVQDLLIASDKQAEIMDRLTARDGAERRLEGRGEGRRRSKRRGDADGRACYDGQRLLQAWSFFCMRIIPLFLLLV